MIRIISFCNVHFIASLCKACERFAPLFFINLELWQFAFHGEPGA